MFIRLNDEIFNMDKMVSIRRYDKYIVFVFNEENFGSRKNITADCGDEKFAQSEFERICKQASLNGTAVHVVGKAK